MCDRFKIPGCVSSQVLPSRAGDESQQDLGGSSDYEEPQGGQGQR